MEQRTYYAMMVGLALVMVIAGISVVIMAPAQIENVTGGMFLVAIGILVLLALVHFPPPHHIKRSFAPRH
ncbi:MAG: hypothetical protein KQA33_00790 [Candidatus Aenigmarchaeota archaeon]|nr:hypothetical protein [Candidatus Aenigmarchaeota archaeon]